MNLLHKTAQFRRAPASLRTLVNLQQFKERNRVERVRVNALRIHSQRSKLAPHHTPNPQQLSQELLPLAELWAMVALSNPDSQLLLSSPDHNLQVAIPAKWLHVLSTHWTLLANPLMKESRHGAQ